MRRLHFVAALALLAPTAAAAEGPRGNGVPQKPGEQVTVVGQQPKLVCETFVPTGSIKSQKICRSQSDWNQTQQDSLTELQRLQDRRQLYRQMRETIFMNPRDSGVE